MSDHDTLPPETDDEIRARLRAFAQDVTERVDIEAALQRMPRRSRPPTSRLLAIAACLLAVVAVAAIVTAHRQSDTTDPSNSPTQTTTTSEPAVGARLAKGEDVKLVGDVTSGLRNQTLNIDAHQQAGEVTGEFRFDDNVITVECAGNILDGLFLGGTATAGSYVEVGDLYALIIREGDPDSVALLPNEYPVWASSTSAYWGGYEADSCDDFLERIPTTHAPPADLFVEVEDGSDIETGDDEGSDENPAADDVTLGGECTIVGGNPEIVYISGEIVNHSSERSNYSIFINIEDPSGGNVGDGVGVENNVDPGQRAEWTANGIVRKNPSPGKLITCQIKDVTRRATG